MIKLSQTVWELWPAQDFGFREDNFITKTVKVVTLTSNIPTGSLLHFYQTLSKYVLGYQSYGLHKTSASEEITRQQIKVVSLACNTPTLYLFDTNATTKYYQNMSKGIKVMERKILASGEITA